MLFLQNVLNIRINLHSHLPYRIRYLFLQLLQSLYLHFCVCPVKNSKVLKLANDLATGLKYKILSQITNRTRRETLQTTNLRQISRSEHERVAPSNGR